MSELSPRAREILDAARRAPCAPDEETTRRMERTVLIAGTTTALTIGGIKAASSGIAGKGVMAAVTLAIVGTTAAVTVAVLPAGFAPFRRARPVQVSAPAPARVPVPVAPADSVVVEAVPEPIAQPEVAPVQPARAKVGHPLTPTLSPPGEREAQEERSSLAAELALLRTAKNEVDASRWATALEALARHDAEFPEGALRVEAEVLRVLAWCGQGRAGDALQRAFELRTKSPNSPAIARLDGSCVDL